MRDTAILLVDDRDENLLALQAVLAPTECRLVTARSGDEALRALLKDDFAVILLDVQMPGLDGFETAELIRARERTRTVPIIFVTAISKEAHHVFRGYEAGAVDYLFKPLDPIVLRSKVEVFVESHERGRALAEREELLRATFEDAPTGMARADAAGRLRHVNRALCETLSREPEALIGRTLDELGPLDSRGAEDDLRDQLAHGRIGRYEIERVLVGPGATTIPVLVSVSQATASEGTQADLILHVQDLRERHRAERDREQLIRAESARAHAEAASERLRLLHAMTVAALAADDLDALLRELLDRLLDALDVDRATLVLVDDDEYVVARAARGVDTIVDRDAASPGDGVVARIAEEQAPVAILDVPGSGIDASSLGGAISSLVAVPLVDSQGVIGSLQLATLTRREFGEETIDLLMGAAGRASLAIARTRSYERERRIAQELQRSLLPRALPRVPGVALAARYEPGGNGATVGGDWYDAIPLPGGRVVVAIGDVVGRGIEAAATMGQMRSAMRAIIMQADDTGSMMERLNRFALGVGDCVLTTVVLAIFEPAIGRLRYTNAGHPPPLLISDGGASFLEGEPAPPLGVVETPRYRQRALELERGSTLLLYTDGLVENPAEPLDAGLARLREAADAAGAGADVEALCAGVLGALSHAGSQSDDVTMIALHALARLDARVVLEVAGDPAALTAARDTVRRWLSEAGAGPDELHDITMACNEACQNAIEHAYELGADLFDVILERDGAQVSVTIRDRGRWRTTTSPDRGRGLDLMRELMESVEVESGESGSTVQLRRSLRAPRPVQADTAVAH